MLAVDGRIDSRNYQAFEKIYTDKTEVRQMFVNAISEKDKRLIAKAEAKGRDDNKRETAKKMKADGIPTDVISKYTGLSQKDIKEL